MIRLPNRCTVWLFPPETASEQAKTGSNELGEVLDLIKTSAWQALKEMRLLLYEMRLMDLENVNLEEAIRVRLDAVEKRAGIRHEIQVSDDFRIPQICSTELYPIMIEALNNSLKHARAEKIDVHFQEEDGKALIVIRDNGVGFDPAAATNGMGPCEICMNAAGRSMLIWKSNPKAVMGR